MEENRKRFVLSMLAYAVQRDLSIDQLCKLSNLDLKKLKNGTHAAITEKQMNELWMNASRLAKDPLFGLHFGESLQLPALGIVGEIIKSSKTIGEALTQAASLISLFTDLFRLEIARKRNSFTIFIKTTKDQAGDPPFSFWQMRDLLMVFLIHELDGLLLEKIKPLTARLSYDAIHQSEYERVLRCKATKSKECSLEFPLTYWNEPVLTANYELQKQLLQKVKSDREKTHHTSLSERLQSYLLSHAYLGILSLEEVSANFGMSARNLQRKLREENTTFQQVADGVRKSLAQHYLSSGDYQLKEISAILGYNELSAFSRAFKRWTGKSPGAFHD